MVWVMRTLAVDLGERRVGLALSDQGGKLATPFDVVEVSSGEQALEAVGKVIEAESVRRVVVGLPIEMEDGKVGPAARAAGEWGKKLAARAQVEVVFVDERLSSFAAEQALASRRRSGEKLTRGRKKRQLDAVAAAGFLQEFLDGKLQPIHIS
jgi:putative Holliday junction resolvase